MIIAKNISKNFGEIKALDDVSFEAGKGVLALLGANGAGKTTLIRILMGYLYPTLGSVKINDIDIETDRITALKLVGYVPENNPIYQEMTSFEFIKTSADLWDVEKELFLKNLKNLAAELDIKDVINQKISTLSKGYKRRVAIAAALIHEPQILILDEPTDGLDPNQKFVVRKFLKEYAKKNTVLISTHIMEDVEAIADRVVILNKGRIIMDTTPVELKNKGKDGDLVAAFHQVTVKD